MNRRDALKGMGVAAMLPVMLSQAAEAAGDETVYELRIYHVNEGKMEALLERFGTHEVKLFAKAGLHPIAYWVPTDAPDAGKTLIYMLRHRSREAAAAAWKAFQTDPEWLAVKASSEKDGPLVGKHDITFMKLTDFSPKV
jgi:hypothetical protein